MNEIYTAPNDYRNYLSHHGILGMKWGKRNGPPYPLGASDHSASEKKAGWRQSLKGNSNSLNSERSTVDSIKTAALKKISSNTGSFNTNAITDMVIRGANRNDIKKQANNDIKQIEKDYVEDSKAQRQHLLNTGTAKDILNNKDKYEFTVDELNRAYNRITAENNLSRLIERKPNKIENAINTATEIAGYIEKGQKVLNTVKPIYNKFRNKEPELTLAQKYLKGMGIPSNAHPDQLKRMIDRAQLLQYLDDLSKGKMPRYDKTFARNYEKEFKEEITDRINRERENERLSKEIEEQAKRIKKLKK